MDHTERSHKLEVHSCNVCDYQTNIEGNLQSHYTLVHSDKRKKESNMGPSPSKTPCNFEEPLHSTTCCDRKSGYRNARLFTRKEKQDNGYCRMGDICKYLHEESPPCYYREQCRDNKCVFFHHQPFLAQSFTYQERDFPPLHQSPRRMY